MVPSFLGTPNASSSNETPRFVVLKSAWRRNGEGRRALSPAGPISSRTSWRRMNSSQLVPHCGCPRCPRRIGCLVVTTAIEDDRRRAGGSHGFEVESDQGVTYAR
jgi:hypothetical protein